MRINPNEISRKQNCRQNALDRVRVAFGRSGYQKDKKKNARKYACRGKFSF